MEQYSSAESADQYMGNQSNKLGDNLNSKILGILLALLATTMVISAASAVDLADNFGNDDFAVKVASGANFTECVNIGINDMKLVIFENSGKDSGDADSIILFKDSSANKTDMASFIKDLEKSGNKVEETDKYVVLKNTPVSDDFDIENDLDSIFNFVGGIFSDEGLNVSADGNSVSISDKGLEISDASGENVSITSEGVSVSGEASSGNTTVDVSSDVNSNIADSDYSVYLKNNDDKVIVISGNNLEVLKAMAETASLK